MRIAVIGTGGIGGPLGASLLKAGIDVTLVARRAHLAAMRENGLHIEGDRGGIFVRPVQVTDDFDDIGTVDVVLSCVKSWDVELAGEQIRAIVVSRTAVIPLQSGIDAAQRLIPILGRPRAGALHRGRRPAACARIAAAGPLGEEETNAIEANANRGLSHAEEAPAERVSRHARR